MGEFDAAGEIVTGGLLGRAIEPRAGEGGGHAEICLNCGTALVGAYCHACGQSAHVHRSLGAIGHEILHGVAHFEGKLWRTLPLLAWRPGELTRRYIEGERARFVSPMALFLFSIFTMFAVFQIFGVSAPTDVESAAARPAAAMAQARKALIEKRTDAIAERDARAVSDPERARLAERIAEADQDLKVIDAAIPKLDPHGVRVSTRRTGWAPLDHGLEKWDKNPSLMLYKLQSSVYKFSWLLIPLSLPFVWLLFAWKREYRLYDHTVFITYSIAFISLLFIAITLGAAAGVSSGLLIGVAFVVPFVHLFRQLKQAYRLGWLATLMRTLVLCFFIEIVLVAFLAILILLGMLG
ncbi:MAG: DUF3667 domain-containing protein [Sphingomonas sp.]